MYIISKVVGPEHLSLPPPSYSGLESLISGAFMTYVLLAAGPPPRILNRVQLGGWRGFHRRRRYLMQDTVMVQSTIRYELEDK